MNIYEKLSTMRLDLQALEIKKSGKNTFAGYDYMELGDFLPRINEIASKHKVVPIISFGSDMAILRLINIEQPDEEIMISSPMSTANLKGCHDVQNLGAVQTYLRRYLYVAAFEIVEHDAIDSTAGKTDKPAQGTPTQKTSHPTAGKPLVPSKPQPSAYTGGCEECGVAITAQEKSFSQSKYGPSLCRACQKKFVGG